ncbi:MAG: glycosyltransferase family 2 protein [Chitinophagales bacterium]|nr:glycosyltransferase family 2 protein [Chitinophagales bacterium]
MKLSVVIVNYNVKHFLFQALTSVFKSVTNFDYEVFVVDNASSDGSIEMIAQHFPQVELIASTENLGFSKGNNLAIRKSNATYILLLNPDTIVREDTFQQVVDFMDKHADAGALGVKMFDGQGIFLPESKRGFPTPKVAFFKMSGLSRIFPKSKIFNQYHLGYLDKDEVHEVDVLSGAFMLLRKSVLDKVGLLDEDYFMYGEDIDLSYRIQKAGYKNYYYPHAPIIHFKGESTKKGSLNYVKIFYKAMIIFAQKHLQRRGKTGYVLLLTIAIYFRAALALFNRASAIIGKQIADITLLISTFIGISWVWEHWVRQADNLKLINQHYLVNLPIYVSIWLFINYLSGIYEKNSKLFHLWISMLIGTALIGTLYGFFPNNLRTSRGIILLTFLIATSLMAIYRLILAWAKGSYKQLFYNIQKMAIVGSYSESKRVNELLNEIGIKRNYLGFISPNSQDFSQPLCIGTLKDFKNIIDSNDINEVIFCAKDISSSEMIKQITSLRNEVQFKMIAPQSEAIIGSHSKSSPGELLTYDIGFKINKTYLRRLKRFSDFSFSLLFLTLSPILIWIQKSKLCFIKNIFSTLIGKTTWVAYDKNGSPNMNIPKLPTGILSPINNFFIQDEQLNTEFIDRQNYLYAKDYHIITDLQTIFNSLNKLGGGKKIK